MNGHEFALPMVEILPIEALNAEVAITCPPDTQSIMLESWFQLLMCVFESLKLAVKHFWHSIPK